MTAEQGREVGGFSLLGGPLHRLGRRVGLVRGANNTVPLGLALGVGAWIVVAALVVAEGLAEPAFSLSQIAGHVRLLLVIPLFFVCETFGDPRMRGFVDTIVASGVVPEAGRPALDFEIARTVRWKDSWIPDVACLVAVVLWSRFGTSMSLHRPGSLFGPGDDVAGMPLAGRWYWFFCLPMFRFLLLRWAWRLALWVRFLWRVSRLDLHLVPTHPDGAAGLGYLEIAQMSLMPLVFALSALQAAAYAEDISSGTMAFEAIYPGIAVILIVVLVLFIGPAFVFLPRLLACRVKALNDYMVFASRYVGGFDRKWVHGTAAPEEPLLGTPDLQSLADLGNSIAFVRNMRVVPVTFRLSQSVITVALLPELPLLLLKYPIADLARKLFERLIGV